MSVLLDNTSLLLLLLLYVAYNNNIVLYSVLLDLMKVSNFLPYTVLQQHLPDYSISRLLLSGVSSVAPDDNVFTSGLKYILSFDEKTRKQNYATPKLKSQKH